VTLVGILNWKIISLVLWW